MRKIIALILISTAMHLVMAAHAVDRTSSVPIAIVIGSGQNVKDLKLTPKNLNLIFWRKQRYWPEGLPIKPVNLNAEHPLRMLFSASVLGSTPQDQTDYWNEQYFNGVLPPYSVDSEEAVIRYVSKTRGAIGYIDACKQDKRIKAALWIVNHRIYKRRPQFSCK